MLKVMALAAVERIINTALTTDPITQAGLQALSGKVLRVNISEPQLSVDVLFCDDHIRFEPVSQSPFEPQGMAALAEPDCSINADSPKHLLQLAINPTGNLPVRGDHRVLMAAQNLAKHFEPDVWAKLESLIGVSAVSYLHLFSQELKPAVAPFADIIKDMAMSVSGVRNTAASHELDAEIIAKKQQLLALKSDIERETARLNLLREQTDKLNTDN